MPIFSRIFRPSGFDGSSGTSSVAHSTRVVAPVPGGSRSQSVNSSEPHVRADVDGDASAAARPSDNSNGFMGTPIVSKADRMTDAPVGENASALKVEASTASGDSRGRGPQAVDLVAAQQPEPGVERARKLTFRGVEMSHRGG